MVFWSNLKLKLKNVFTRSDFEREAVKLTGNQTIRGNKTFENDVSINSTLTMNDNPIRAVKYPEREGEAANKKYVDDAIANIPSVDLSNYYTKQQTNEKFVDLTTNQNIEGEKRFNGVCRVARTPTVDLMIANKKYVDDGLRNKADNVNVYNKSQVYTKSECDNRYYRRGDIPTPTGANDAVNKSYVDNKPGLGIRSISRSISSFRTTTITSNQYLITFTVDTRGINQILGIIFNTVTNLNFVPIKYFINTSNGTCVVLSERNYFDLQTPTSVTIKYL